MAVESTFSWGLLKNDELKADMLEGYLRHLEQQELRPDTVRRRISAVKSLLSSGCCLGYLGVNVGAAACSAVSSETTWCSSTMKASVIGAVESVDIGAWWLPAVFPRAERCGGSCDQRSLQVALRDAAAADAERLAELVAGERLDSR